MVDHKPLARVVVTYVSAVQPHHQTISVKIDGTPVSGVEPDVVCKDGTTLAVSTGLAALWDKLKAGLAAGTKIGYYEVQARTLTSDPWNFIWAGDLALSGTSGEGTVEASQAVWTFKTQLGNRLNLYLMDTVADPNFRELPPLAAGWYKDVSDYVLSAASIVRGQDEQPAFGLHAFTTKTNDPNRKHNGFV